MLAAGGWGGNEGCSRRPDVWPAFFCGRIREKEKQDKLAVLLNGNTGTSDRVVNPALDSNFYADARSQGSSTASFTGPRPWMSKAEPDAVTAQWAGAEDEFTVARPSQPATPARSVSASRKTSQGYLDVYDPAVEERWSEPALPRQSQVLSPLGTAPSFLEGDDPLDFNPGVFAHPEALEVDPLDPLDIGDVQTGFPGMMPVEEVPGYIDPLARTSPLARMSPLAGIPELPESNRNTRMGFGGSDAIELAQLSHLAAAAPPAQLVDVAIDAISQPQAPLDVDTARGMDWSQLQGSLNALLDD